METAPVSAGPQLLRRVGAKTLEITACF